MSYVAGQITASGLVVAPLTGTSEAGLTGVVDYLVQQMNTIYGNTIDFSSNTADGQAINIFGQIVEDILQLLLQINSGFDPTQAFGNILYMRGAINGLQVQAATYSTVTVTVTVSGACALYGLDQTTQPAYTIADQSGNQWQLQTTQSPSGSGSYSYTFQAANAGPINAAPGTITIPVTTVLQVTALTNPTDAVPGNAQETDAQFKLRQQQSTALGSIGYLPGLQAALRNISGITYASAYENTSDDSSSYGQDPHSVWVIVSPGSATEEDIADVIYVKHNGGCGIYVRSSGSPTPQVVTYVIPATITFVVASANATVGAIYTNNGNSYTVLQSISGGDSLLCSISGGNPTTSGTLTLSSGTGDPTIPFTAYEPGAAPFVVQWNEVIESSLYCLFYATSLDGLNMPALDSLIAVGDTLTPAVGVAANVNQLVTALTPLDPNSLITFPGLGSGESGIQVGAATANEYAATGSPEYLDQQLSITTDTVIAVMNGVTQDFSGVDSGLGSVAHQLQVQGYGGQLSSGSFSAQTAAVSVAAGASQTFEIYGGYFAAGIGSPAVTLYQNNSSGSVLALANCVFTCLSANATQGATYTNNGQTFTVLDTIAGATTLTCSGTGNPTASGTLTKASGSGDATITFSAVSLGMNPFTVSYTAGSTSGVYDVIKVIDSLGNLSYIAVSVVAA